MIGKSHIGTDLLSRNDQSRLPREDVFEVLSNARRRCIVHYLKKHEGRRVELRELVDYVAAWENDTTIEDLDSQRRKSVYAAIRQTHLPKMEDAGVIDYEHLRGEIELTDAARDIQLYLECVPDDDIPWSEHYLSLSAVGAALVVVTWLGIQPFQSLQGVGLAALVVLLFALSATVHTYQSVKNRLGSGEYEIDG